MSQADRLPPAAGRLAGLVLTGAGAAALLVCVRFVYAAVRGERRFATPVDILLYYVAPAAIGLLLLASRRLSAVGRFRVLMSVVGALFALYFAEGVLLLARGSPDQPALLRDGDVQPVMTSLLRSRNRTREGAELAAQVGRPIDVRTPAEVIQAHREQGVAIERIITASNQLFLTRPDGRVEAATMLDGREVVPLGGVSRLRTLMCNENGYWVDFLSDRHGFNNPDTVWDAPSLDVAAIGDSFTQGYCVPPGDSFVDLIRKHRPGALNLGIAGDGPLLELATLTEFLPAFKPKTVFWFYFEGNDLDDLPRERKDAVLMQYLRDGFSQPALADQREVDRLMMDQVPRLLALEAEHFRDKRWQSVLYRAASFAKLTALRNQLSPVRETDAGARGAADDLATANFDVFRTALTLARDRAASWGGTLYFVYLPDWARFSGYRSWGIEQRARVLDIVRSLGIPTIDLLPSFEASHDPLSLFPFRQSGHYTEAGHQLVARIVIARLDADGSRQ